MKAMRWVAAAVAIAALLFGAGALAPLSPEGSPVSGGTSATAATDGSALGDAGEALDLLRRSRAEADPSLLLPARTLLSSSLEKQPKGNFAATLGRASLANASHRFSDSVIWARKAIRIDRYAASSYGVLGDALFELGRIDAADRAYQKMVDLRPDVASYVRASYAAQSHNNYPAALHAMNLAIEAAGPVGEEAAWLRHQRGDIFFSQGRFDRALQDNTIGTEIAPGYAPPLVGMAEALIALERLDEALPLVGEAVAELPALEYLVTLGDLRWALGEREAARDAYGEAATKLTTYRAHGVAPDSDFILFYADHGVRLRAGLREARSIHLDRPTSATADALAWMLHANGRDQSALRYAEQALATATAPDALQHFHAGMIAIGAGDDERGQRWLRSALELDPAFSLVHRTTARRTLRFLGDQR